MGRRSVSLEKGSSVGAVPSPGGGLGSHLPVSNAVDDQR